MEKRSELRILLIWVGLPEILDHQGAREVGSAGWGEEVPALCNAPEATTRVQLLSISCNPPTFTALLCMPEAALGAVRGRRDKGLSRVTVDSGSVCGEREGRGLNSTAGKWWVGAGNDEPLLEGQPGLRMPDAGAHA